MAFDKVIDSAQLEADLTTVADAIRAKGETTEPLAFPDGYKSAIESIEVGVDTSDATAKPEHVPQGYTFYAQGKKQTGTARLLNNTILMDGTVSRSSTDIITRRTMDEPGYSLAGRDIAIRVAGSKYGDATSADVVKGKTFTSYAGLNIEGTYEPPVSAGGVSF